MTAPSRPLLTALAVPLLLATAACSGSSDGPGDPEEALAAAKEKLDDTPGITLALSTEELPDGIDGLMDATGVGTHAPAFEGEINLSVNGLELKVPIVAVDGLVFAKLPFTKSYAEIDPADYGAPDPAQLMDSTTGLSAWLTEASDVEKGEAVRDGEEVLTPYAGTLSGATVADSIPSADDGADFTVTFFVDDDGELRSVDASGPFYGEGGDVDYTIELTDYGTDQEITRP